MAGTDIKQLLSYDVYQALVGAAAPSGANVFATMADITGGGGDLATTLGLGDTATSGQDINLIAGLFTIDNGAVGPTGASLEISSVVGEILIKSTGIGAGGQDIRLQTSSIGSLVILDGQTGISTQGFAVEGLGFTSTFTMAATGNNTYTFKDASGTVAFLSDITGTNSGTNTGDQTSIVGITGTKAQFNTACTDGDFAYATGQTYTPSNVTTDRTYDANSTTLDELADVVGTLIADLKTSGIIL